MVESTVFVSYRRCKRDAAVLDRLEAFLTPLEKEGLICGWTDRDIEGGQRWSKEIDAALARTRIAVLLISQDFYTSDFICNVELPRLLAREASGLTTILPVFVSPADPKHEVTFEDEKGVRQRILLSDIQGSVAHPTRTLAEMESAEREREFLRLVERIRELVDARANEAALAPPSPAPSTISLRVDCIDGLLTVEALNPTPTPTQTTSLAKLKQALDARDHDALFRSLFSSPHHLDELVAAAAGRPQAVDPTARPLRLRLVCANDEAALLPWHCLTHNGRRLGEAGWIVEVISEPDGDALTIALDNPLVVAPSDPTLPISARSHATNVIAYVRRMLADCRATVPWVSNGRELDAALANEPDLLYVFAQIDAQSGFILGKDADHREPYPLDGLIERLKGFRAKPLVWLHLVAGGDSATETAARLSERLRPLTRLLLIQLTTQGKAPGSLASTLAWMDAMADGKEEPAAVLSRLGSLRDTHLWLSGRSVRLSPCSNADAALIEYIRASLIRLLLGRKPEKRQLGAGIREKPEGYLTLYGVCGDAQACVHDLPEQARHYIEALDRHTVVEARPLPLTMRASPAVRDEVASQLIQDLSISAIMPALEALRRIPVVPPDREDTLIIALSWLLEPAVDFTADLLPDWLESWKRGLLDVLDKEQIPPDFRLLVSACIQWPDGWPERHDSNALALQQDIDRILDQANPRDYVHCIEMQRPLSVLRAADLREFYGDQALRRRLHAQDQPVDRLVDYILDRTGGRFQDTVDLIYTERKHRYAGFHDSLTGLDA